MQMSSKNRKTNADYLASRGSLRGEKFKEIWRRLRKNKLSIIGLVFIVALVLCAILAPFITPYSYDVIDLTATFQGPSMAHLLGTDNYGRDMLTRIIFGARTSLLVAISAIAIALVVGGSFGSIAAFYGNKIDGAIMRILDVFMAIPPLLMAVAVSAALGEGALNSAIAIAMCTIPNFARIIRASALTIKSQEYIEAARACGGRDFKIIWKHLIPNSLAPIMVQSTLQIGNAILQISMLSFIGLGVQPPTPEWGNMLAVGREFIRDFPPMVLYPGVAIMLTLISFNVLGDGLRDALDPRLKQ